MDVFKDDIIKYDKQFYIVLDEMQTNNGNFRAMDPHHRMIWLNTEVNKIEIIKRASDKRGK